MDARARVLGVETRARVDEFTSRRTTRAKARETGSETARASNVDGGAVKPYPLDKPTREAVRASGGAFVDEGSGVDACVATGEGKRSSVRGLGTRTDVMTRVIFETQRDATLRDARRRRRPGEEVRGGDFRERARCRRLSCAKWDNA